MSHVEHPPAEEAVIEGGDAERAPQDQCPEVYEQRCSHSNENRAGNGASVDRHEDQIEAPTDERNSYRK
jgi:hypothetical protein